MQKFLPAIRIFLFILIVIGIGLLLTQKKWLPPLTEKILQRERVEKVAGNPNDAPFFAGRNCYVFNQPATKDAPYLVNETIDLTVTGNSVVGIKNGTQKGPDMQNGYTGNIEGSINGKTLTDNFFYTIEGSKGIEQEEFLIESDSLVKQRYMLMEKDGILVPNKTSEPKQLIYKKVECSTI